MIPSSAQFLPHLVSLVDSLFQMLTPVVIMAYFVFGIDDFFIDLIALLFSIRPQELTPAQLKKIDFLPEKKIAILIAAWHEQGIIGPMVLGNLRNIRYLNYDIFLGVYPNDHKTRFEARELAVLIKNVHVIENRLDGPTSKGQMINQMIQKIMMSETQGLDPLDAVLIHDSEDLIHPDSLKVINWELEFSDFVQIPVFSLPLSPIEMVGGTYLDEFVESHTKDILVRHQLCGSIPSAGVGTAVSRELIESHRSHQGGCLLNPRSLTEDYELGILTGRYRFPSRFACYFKRNALGKRDYIATREFFPKSISGSIRQKTRWTLGIVFQGTEHLGWKGGLAELYFLYRDRKGPIANLFLLLGNILIAYFLIRKTAHGALGFGFIDKSHLLSICLIVNFSFMANRLFQRMHSVIRVYNLRMALLVPLRVWVGNFVNVLASFQALTHYVLGKITGSAPRWAKTEHELPNEFG